MEDYLILEKENELEEVYYITYKSLFNEIPESETYDSFGQTIDTANAGDSVELLSQKAVNIINKTINDVSWDDVKFEVSEIIYGYENSDIYDNVIEMLEKECEEGIDYKLCQDMCKAYNYWNGHNWNSIIIEMENGEPEYKVVSNEVSNIIIDLLKNNKLEFVSDNYGFETYHNKEEGYSFVNSHWQGSWEQYKVTPIY